MNRDWPTPSMLTTLDARLCRLTGFEDGYFRVLSITHNTVIIVYAGYEIFFKRDKEKNKIKPRPRLKSLEFLQKEDRVFLAQYAQEILHGIQAGDDYLAEKKQAEEEFEQKCEEAAFLIELSQEKEIGTASDRIEELRQQTFIAEPEESDDESTAES